MTQEYEPANQRDVVVLPLAVDLDGTLLATDTLYESLAQLLRKNFLFLFVLPLWLLAGRANLKQRIAHHIDFDPVSLPTNQALINWLVGQKEAGRTLILATASEETIANSIAQQIGLFEAVLASDGSRNLKGEEKARALEAYFEGNPFAYAGDSTADFAVWKVADSAVLVGTYTSAFRQKVLDLVSIEAEFPTPRATYKTLTRQLRIHQWAKNILLLVPAIAGHTFFEVGTLWALFIAFLSFSICASSVYLANDFLDLQNDRQHTSKCYRPLASGELPLQVGILIIPVLITLAVLLALALPVNFQITLAIYYATTWAYSLGLKRQPVVDCVVLASLYTLRVIAGGMAVGHDPSFWLLTFSVFLFLSLAFAKRFVELSDAKKLGKGISGRGYSTDDLFFVHIMGVSSGLISVLVLGLYLNSPESLSLYAHPQLLWIAVGLFLYWVCWVWLKANRGEMHDDPVVFALKDRTSLITGGLFGICVLAATSGLG